MSDWAAKRFWSDVTVDLRGEDYVILLDKRLVKTPAKATLAVPSQAMAAGDCGGVGGARRENRPADDAHHALGKCGLG